MITPAELAGVPLFAAIPHALRARIAARSADIRANTGEWIAHEGDPPYFWTMLEGEVERVMTVAGEEVQATTFDPGEYFGEVPLMLSSASFAAIRALRPSRVMRTDPADFHLLLTESADAAAIIAQSMSRRVAFISNAYTARNVTQATIVGDRLDFACHDIRDFLSRNQIAFEWFDPNDPADAEIIPAPARSAARYPLVLLNDGRVLEVPDNRELAGALNLQIAPRAAAYDVVIVGAGPAGLAAAVYGGSEGLRTVMIDIQAPGGQAGTSSRIENYLGFPVGVSGGDLASRALQQAQRFGTEMLVTRSVGTIAPAADGYVVTLDGDEAMTTRAIVLATGVTWRELTAEGAAGFVGRGVYYGAARTEGSAVRGKDIFLVGGGNSAGQAAMFFSSYARTVTLLVRGDSLERSMSHYLIARAGHQGQHRRRNGHHRGARRRRHASGDDRDAQRQQRATVSGAPTRCSPSSARTPRRRGCPPNSSATSAATCARAATSRPGPRTARRFRWRRACPASSRPATCAAIRSSASPRPSAKAAW